MVVKIIYKIFNINLKYWIELNPNNISNILYMGTINE